MCMYIAHLDWIFTRVGPYGPSGLSSIPGSVSQSGEPLSVCQHILPDFSVPGDLWLVAKTERDIIF